MRLFIIATALLANAAPRPEPVTYHRHIAPILQARCQGCHRAGEIGPMALESYTQARPWAKAIKEAVTSRKMPPWFADPAVGKFHNDPSLSIKEIAAIAQWADTGAPEGNPKDAPAAPQFTDGWSIGQPDAVFEMPVAYDVPATGTIEYTDVIIPTGFTEDKWVEKIEIRPGNRAVVHHISAYVREPHVNWLRSYPLGVPFVQRGKGAEGREARPWETRLSGYAPGSPPEFLGPDRGRLFKAGSDLILEIHYTANDKPAKDRSKIGLVFSKRPPAKRVVTLSAKNLGLAIPPGDPAYSIDGSLTLFADCELSLVYPHMHVRGKAMEMRAVYPTGEREVLLRVPRYDFNWQLRYEPLERKALPRGTRIEATGVFDNSPNNRWNPDPKSLVRWGDQSWEEMMVGFVEVAFDAKLDIHSLVGEVKPRN